jgi:hypothetical protein
LAFRIDALGGGYLRAPVTTLSFPYTGDLQSFEAHYAEMMLESNSRQQAVALYSAAFILLCAVAGLTIKVRKQATSRRT